MTRTPGILDFTLPLRPLAMVSPSQYERLKRCALQGTWAGSRQPSLEPIGPAAHLGSIIHRILEEAAYGRFWPEVAASISERWEELVADTERSMKDSWLERHLVPLRSSVAGYEVRMRLALARASQLAQRLDGGRRDVTLDRAPRGSELWVENSDRSVGGRIDRVEVSAAGAMIQDFKSGRITEDSATQGHSRVIFDYESQLMLYAALYAEQTGRWPIALELVPLEGAHVRIDVDRSACLDLLNSAIALRTRVNRTLTSLADSPDEAERRLASPSASTCSHCPYRPACHAYWQARSSAPRENWPKDLSGAVLEIRTLGNSKMAMTLSTTEEGVGTARVVGISPDEERHPALERLKLGDQVIILNLRQSGGVSTYNESQLTVIYRLA